MTIDEQIEAVQKATPENPVWVDTKINPNFWYMFSGEPEGRATLFLRDTGTDSGPGWHLDNAKRAIKEGLATIIHAPFPPKPETIMAGWELTGECRVPNGQEPWANMILDKNGHWQASGLMTTSEPNPSVFGGRRWIVRRVEEPVGAVRANPPKPEKVEGGWELTGECREPKGDPFVVLYSYTVRTCGTPPSEEFGGRRWIARLAKQYVELSTDAPYGKPVKKPDQWPKWYARNNVRGAYERAKDGTVWFHRPEATWKTTLSWREGDAKRQELTLAEAEKRVGRKLVPQSVSQNATRPLITVGYPEMEHLATESRPTPEKESTMKEQDIITMHPFSKHPRCPACRKGIYEFKVECGHLLGACPCGSHYHMERADRPLCPERSRIGHYAWRAFRYPFACAWRQSRKLIDKAVGTVVLAGLGWGGLWLVHHGAAYAIARGALGLVALAGRGLMMLV